ncbi:MAG: DoxX family protein [Gammaproteobacteria bacterium]|nr:MAG: DoxX family protein [Gammaproteobacteria bacterium]TDJ42596.1 MAG: DoxX family protein [Gammaproteobacteria bacterium]
MSALLATVNGYYDVVVQRLRSFEGLAPLLIRLYLAPIMIQAGWNKIVAFDNTVAWFGNPDWGLGLPFPALMAALAVGAEFLGGIALIVGLATRLVAIPLMFTMVVAMTAVHWDNGWLALSDSTSWLANERVMEAIPRKAKVIEILKEHGNYRWLTGRGSITVLNNGIEFAATYFVMLLTLLFTGGGRYTSLDYLLARWRAAT